MHKANNLNGQDVAAQSLEQVLGEAMQEIHLLEEKNVKMQDVLSELHTGILNLNNSVSSMRFAEASTVDEKIPNKDETFLEQFQDFERISSDITSKLSSMIRASSGSNDGLLQDAFQSGIHEVKKKLSSLSMIIQQLSKDKNTKSEIKLNLNVPSICLPVDESIAENDNFNSNSMLDSTVGNLQIQLKDALDKNIRWQNYNAEREQYVSLLLSKYNHNCNELQQMREKLAIITSQPDKLAVEQRRHFDSLLVGARQELESQRNENMKSTTELNILKEKCKEETCRLESNVEHWRTRYEEQRECIAALNAHYEHEKRRSNNNEVQSKEKQTQIQLLQSEVHRFSEDFQAERKEKKIAFREIDTLKLKVNQLQRENEKQKKISVPFKTISTVDHVKANNDYNSKARKKTTARSIPIINSAKPPSTSTSTYSHLTNQHSITTRRAPPTPKPRLQNHDKKNVKPSNFSSTVKSSHPKAVKERTFDDFDKKLTFKQPMDNDSMLHCPNCDKQYSIDEHMVLLDHIDICGD